MNQGQTKYVRERAEGIFRRRQAAIRKAHVTPAVKLTDDEKVAALKAGKFVADRKETGTWYWRIRFSAEKDEKTDQPALDKEMAALESAYQTLLDELMLGDNERALQLLTSFEAEG